MKNMRIKVKLMTGFLIIAGLGVLLALVGIFGMSKNSAALNTVNTVGDNSVLAQAMATSIHEQRAAYRVIYVRSSLGQYDRVQQNLQEFLRLEQELNDMLEQAKQAFVTDEGVARINPIVAANVEFQQLAAQFVQVAQQDFDSDALMAVMEPLNDAGNKTAELIEELAAYGTAASTRIANESMAQAKLLMGVLLGLLIVSLAIAIILAIYLANMISSPINALVAAAKKLAIGDIDVHVEIDNRDETGDLAHAFDDMAAGIRQQAEILPLVAAGDFTVSIPVRSPHDVMNQSINSMVESNNDIMTNLSNTSSQVSSGAGQIAQAAQNLATGSSQQAATIQEFTAAITEVQSKADEVVQVAEGSFQEISRAGELMGECNQAMEQTMNAMTDINTSSQSISKVIKVIDDIAFQTNILALNAAVEAARAGQHGKGFAVVADEVRNLASKSAEAAKETASLIENSLRSAEEGNEVVHRVNESLQAVGEIAARNLESITAMNDASKQQSDSLNQITSGIAQLSSVVQANSATSEETAASSEEMSAQASVLDQIVSQFKLKGMENRFESAPSSSAGSFSSDSASSGFALSGGDASSKY